MKILLINPTIFKPVIAPLGLEYIAEHLIKRNHTVDLIDITSEPEMKKDIVSGYDLVGINIRNIDNIGFRPIEFYLPPIKNLIKRIKKESNIPIIIGGSAVNLMPEEIRKYVGADCAVVGKGFRAIERLINSLEKKEKLELVIEDRSDFVRGYFKRDVISHLEYQKEGMGIGIATKFGCPFNCSYCDYPIIDGHKLRKRNPEEVIYEIEKLQKQGIDSIFFCDSNFNVSAEHGTAILRELNRKNIKIRWGAFINPHPEAFTEEFFQELVKSGKQIVTFGVDSLSEKGLFSLNKGFTIKDVYRATQMCQSEGIKVSYSLLFGHPDETKKEVIEAFRNIDRLNPKYVDIVLGIRLYRHTSLYYECLSKGIITKKQQLLEPYYLPIPEKIKKIIIKEVNEMSNCHLSNKKSLKMYND